MRRTIALIAIVAGLRDRFEAAARERHSASASSRWRDRGWRTPAGPAPSSSIGLLAVDIFIPVPSSIVMVLSGAAFGVWWGSLLAFAGSIGGEWLGFELARRYGIAWFARFIGDEDERQRLNRIAR